MTIAWAEEPDLDEIVRNPVIGNYKGYAEFKMGHYETARVIWEALAKRGNGEANFNLGTLYEDGLGVPQ
ncbi:MAG: sel1 repeat family protein, partial [Pseudomonadota bacterium]|nr:sel1 repeat family protein [Pseudomonadota bacterium]